MVDDRRARITDVFRTRFGAEPALFSRAPGRVELMGSHTDYNLGYVLTLPVHLDTWMAARPRSDRQVQIFTMDLGEQTSFSLDAIERASRWSNYVRGVIWKLGREGLAIRAMDAVVETVIPLGGGLSSSAALQCVTAVTCEALGGWTIDPVRMAVLCQQADNEFAGIPCGILDQYSSCVSAEGGALLLDCRDLSSKPVRLAAGLQIVVCDTRSKRELAGSEYAIRRAQCEEGARQLGVSSLREISLDQFEPREQDLPTVVARRCRFILEENTRVFEFAAALTTGDRPAIGRLTRESFRGACDLYEIGAPSMTSMMEAIERSPGVVGARQSGGGFGGCLMAVVDPVELDAFVPAVAEAYAAATGVEPAIYPVGPGAAAGVLKS